MSLEEPEPVNSVLTFLSGYDTLEYSWVKATEVSMRLRILFVTLQSTIKGLIFSQAILVTLNQSYKVYNVDISILDCLTPTGSRPKVLGKSVSMLTSGQIKGGN